MKADITNDVAPPAVQALRRALPDLHEVARSGDDVFLAELRLALQLPRFAEVELRSREAVVGEIQRVLDRIRRDQQSPSNWRWSTISDRTLESGAYEVRPVADRIASEIHTKLHYIGSAREGVHFGLFDKTSDLDSSPLSLLSFSQFDLAFLEVALPSGVEVGQASVLSRAYSFPRAPANAFSYTFSRAIPLLRNVLTDVKLIVTYVNPNVGFSGSSYLASNWLPFAEEANVRYEYLDSQYITRRELGRRFGATDFRELRALLGSRIATSELPLWPLRLFAYPVVGRLREILQRRASALFQHES